MNKHIDTCPSCGSQKIVMDAEFPDAVDFGVARAAILRVAARPKAAIFKERAESTLTADVCGECGFVQLYVTRPDKLWDAYRRSRSAGE